MDQIHICNMDPNCCKSSILVTIVWLPTAFLLFSYHILLCWHASMVVHLVNSNQLCFLFSFCFYVHLCCSFVLMSGTAPGDQSEVLIQ